MNYSGFARRRLLERMASRLSDEDKTALVQLIRHQEVMDAMRRNDDTLQQIINGRRHEWVTNFGSDVAANILTNFLFILGTKLLNR